LGSEERRQGLGDRAPELFLELKHPIQQAKALTKALRHADRDFEIAHEELFLATNRSEKATHGTQFTCFTGTQLLVLSYWYSVTCFTGTKIQILTQLRPPEAQRRRALADETSAKISLLALLVQKYKY
jgi:hypothetical protein